jgi:hypothetical protein
MCNEWSRNFYSSVHPHSSVDRVATLLVISLSFGRGFVCPSLKASGSRLSFNSGTGAAYHSGAREITPVFSGVRVT